jgi:cysteine synthase
LDISHLDWDRRRWVREAVQRINADFNRSADTHLIKVDLPGFPDQTLYLKDESTHPTGSLKHRLARSLYLFALCNGWIGPDTVIVESSSGSTAVSEAYFARLLGLRFIAVVQEGVSRSKIDQIAFYGGETRAVPPADIYAEAQRITAELGGHYMDQFTYAERVTDWRGNNNIAESLFSQLSMEAHALPDWVVMSAGTGGTSATIGRFIRYRCDIAAKTSLCVADPENSVFYDHYETGDPDIRIGTKSRIEGIGRPRVEASFQPDVIDRMMRVPDAASIATIHWLQDILGRRCGGSTGTNVWAALTLMREMRAAGQAGSVATLICDGGERYLDTYYDDAWIASQGLDLTPYLADLQKFTRG